MQFFVPGATNDDDSDRLYRELAKMCWQPIVADAPADRIRSITWVHNGSTWTATVGEELTGVRHRTTRTRSGKRETTTPVRDPGVKVLAIYDGAAVQVVTDARPLSERPSHWVNPFMAGRPQRIERFSGDLDDDT